MKAGAEWKVVAFLVAQSIYETAEECSGPRVVHMLLPLSVEVGDHESHPEGLCWYVDAFS